MVILQTFCLLGIDLVKLNFGQTECCERFRITCNSFQVWSAENIILTTLGNGTILPPYLRVSGETPGAARGAAVGITAIILGPLYTPME